jgi:integrase
MASLQLRGESYSCIFMYHGKRQWLTLGKLSEADAIAARTRIEHLLRLIKQRLLELPPGIDIVSFMENDGKKPPQDAPVEKEELTLGALRDQYLRVHSNGTLEQTTLAGITQHFKHLAAILGAKFPINALSLADLQQYVDRRAKANGLRGKLSPATIQKEIVTLRTAWNWAVEYKLVSGKFPKRGLRYPRSVQKPPFMTWDEIARRIKGGEDAGNLWECLYLRTPEIADLLAYAKEHAAHPWIYPFFCFAAHTGARRSEIIRATIADVDFATDTITIHEKKRVRGKDSTRRVPLTAFLKRRLQEWLAIHPGGNALFCFGPQVGRSKKRSANTGYVGGKKRPTTLGNRMGTVQARAGQGLSPLTRNEVRDHWARTLAGSKWESLRGLHTLRHSYISALANAGVDQRIIKDICGHMTDEMAKRYAHLYPSTKHDAVSRVFS